MNHDALEHLRKRIGETDRELVRLLNERAQLSLEIGREKEREGREVYDPAQESRVYSRLSRINEGPLPVASLREIFREIISSSRDLQEPVSVAYLGPEASFSHMAGLSHFGRAARFLPQTAIEGVFEEVERGRSRWGLAPVENSAEGSVKPTLERLIHTPLTIRAEVLLRIRHVLVSTSDRLEAVQRVYSHPQALAQCRRWLRENLPGRPLLDVESTAAAARRVLEDPEGGAVGSSLAAATYGLKPLAEGIEDSVSNTTRFLVVGRGKSSPTGEDKTSLLFGTAHAPGALCRALEPIAREGLNLLRIESYPIRERAWEYLFFADLAGHMAEEATARCLKEMEKRTTHMKVLGSYPRGEESP
jgi:chorismate mutase/prephenate dehydratase